MGTNRNIDESNLQHTRLGVDRSKQIRRDNDKSQDPVSGLYDIDETIQYYFTKVLKLQVTDSSNKLVPVPVSYASPENWKSYQKSEIKRDTRGKIQLPFLVFKRDNIEKDRNLGNKVDVNKPIYSTREIKTYDPGNRYDRFSTVINQTRGRQPVKKLQKIVIPDYLTITYSCIVYTEFLTQMNKIIEAISYGEGGYWGDKNSFLVRAKVDSFPSAVEVNMGEDRVVKSEFNITINGQIIPQTILKQAKMGSTLTYTKAKVSFNESTTTDINKVLNRPENNLGRYDNRETNRG